MTDLAKSRELLLEQLARRIRSPEVLQAIAAVPRERFVPAQSRSNAYLDIPLPIGEGQTISQPTMVAEMTAALRVAPGQDTRGGYRFRLPGCVAGKARAAGDGGNRGAGSGAGGAGGGDAAGTGLPERGGGDGRAGRQGARSVAPTTPYWWPPLLRRFRCR